jgi:hypothetical protein
MENQQDKNYLVSGSKEDVFYELCHLLDAISHAIGFDGTKWGYRFCQWSHRKEG